MSTATYTEKWDRVTRHDPCPICESDHWCKVSPDGAFVCCMWNSENAYRLGRLKTGEPYAVHRLRDDRPYEPQSPTFTIPTPEDDAGFDVLTARAVYAVTAAHCAAELPDFVRAELVRRFGPVNGPLAIERFGLGYCESPQLVKALDAAGRRTEALAAGVLHPQRGQAVHSLAGRITIPYRRGGGVLDIRGAGIKGRGETKEMSLPGGYVERDVAGLFFNHDALDNLAPGEPIHIAGGAYKTMALALCGLPAIGTRGEGELSVAQLAALQAAGVTDAVLHIDAEEAKEGERLSSGRRLGLPKAERLAAAGFVVAIAEPAREPGTPKVDPDALLRDLGPRAVRDYALSAIALDAWRVVIGVASPDVSTEVAKEVDELRRKHASAQKMLANVVQIRRNGAIKAERDTLTACILHIAGEQANGRGDAEGWVRQPARTVADSVGKGVAAVRTHRQRGAGWGLLDLKLVTEYDEQTGQRRTVTYARTRPDEALDKLVSIDPVREEKAGWGGKREPCPRCGSQRRRTVVTCADCQLELSNKVDEPAPEPDTVADIPVREGAPESIPPTPVEEMAATPTYPAGPISYHATASGPVRVAEQADEDEPADDWDPHFCNHIDHRGQQCTARIDPALGKRYCWQHRQAPIEPSPVPHGAAAFTLGGVRYGPPRAEAPPLDPAVAEGIARQYDGQTIVARLSGFQARWDGGERTEDLLLLMAEWRQIAAARRALDAVGQAVG